MKVLSIVPFLLLLGLLPIGVGCDLNASRPASLSEQPLAKSGEHYTCPMHPQVHSEKPGKCPICHMDLILVGAGKTAEGKVPSASAVEGRAPIQLTSEQEVLANAKSVEVKETTLNIEIQAPGRVVSGSQVSFQVYERDVEALHAGQSFTATAPSVAGSILKGQITSVEAILDPMTRTARVNGTLASANNPKLRPESSLSGTILVKRAKVLGIPEGAVIHTGSADLVFVTDQKGGYLPRKVELGAQANGFYEVKSGLAAGAVISGGPNFLLDSESRIRANDDTESH